MRRARLPLVAAGMVLLTGVVVGAAAPGQAQPAAHRTAQAPGRPHALAPHPLAPHALAPHALAPHVLAPHVLAPGVPSMPVAAELTTAAVDTSSVSVPVPAGVTPTAITAVVTQTEVVTGGSIQFSLNGAPALSVPSSLYQKVSIPVAATNVTADGVILVSVATQAAPVAGAVCTPQEGTAVVRKVALEYTGTETPPATVDDFFGPTSAQVDVIVPAVPSDDMIEAGLTAVDALAQRYDDKTPIALTTKAPNATTAVASQRAVALVDGPAGEVTASMASTGGVPTLTLTGSGDELADAARSLSSDALVLGGTKAMSDPSTEMKSRSVRATRTLTSLGIDQLTLTGYGSTTQRVVIDQDDFGAPVQSLRVHLAGSHTAFAADAAARLDVRANGALVGSQVLGSGSGIDLDVTVPAGRLQSVNDLDLTMTALSPTGLACTPPAAPLPEVDIDPTASTVHATSGTGSVEGFQLYPQVFEGTLPVAIRSTGQQRTQSAIDAADLIAALQRAAGSQFDIQVVDANAFLADNRSGIMVGAVAQDSVDLDAPLRLSSTRRLDRADSRFAVTSQDPYATLESIDRNDRFVLMLGSWAPGGVAAPGALSRKVVDAVGARQWSSLSGDLVIADDTIPAFDATSRSLKPHVADSEDRSYVGWFVVAIALLLLLLAFQVVVSIRRDRAGARAEADPDGRHDGPAYVEDEDPLVTDELGDIDDLEVAPSGASRPSRGASPAADRAGDVEDRAPRTGSTASPAAPETQTPETPETPETSDTPETPDEPETPDAPETPGRTSWFRRSPTGE